jgi:hypothetical protein
LLLIHNGDRWVARRDLKVLFSLHLLLVVELPVFVNVDHCKLSVIGASNICEGTILQVLYACLGGHLNIGDLGRWRLDLIERWRILQQEGLVVRLDIGLRSASDCCLKLEIPGDKVL